MYTVVPCDWVPYDPRFFFEARHVRPGDVNPFSPDPFARCPVVPPAAPLVLGRYDHLFLSSASPPDKKFGHGVLGVSGVPGRPRLYLPRAAGDAVDAARRAGKIPRPPSRSPVCLLASFVTLRDMERPAPPRADDPCLEALHAYEKFLAALARVRLSEASESLLGGLDHVAKELRSGILHPLPEEAAPAG